MRSVKPDSEDSWEQDDTEVTMQIVELKEEEEKEKEEVEE